MNKSHLPGAKIIQKQMDDEQLPIVPKNRHQRRAIKKTRAE